MKSNNRQHLVLALLMSAATPVVAAPAPVTDVTGTSGSSLERIERLLEARNQVQLDMQRQLQQLSGEVDQLRGMVEQNTYQLNQVVERQRDLYRELDQLNQHSAKPATEQPETKGNYSSNVSENEAYDNAVALVLEKKDFDGAISAFNQFLAAYPNSTYGSNAHYWLGQIYFAKGQAKSASSHFQTVVSDAQSSKRADSLLKLGLIYRTSDKVKAKQYLQQVISQYPESATATQAKEALAKL